MSSEKIQISRRRFLLGGAVGVSSLLLPGAARAQFEPSEFWQQPRRYFVENPRVIVAEVKIYKKGYGFTYFAPHHNEQDSVRAAKKIIDQYGGRLIELVHPGGRIIEFEDERKLYAFDPNRMFSDRGARASLKNQGQKNYSDRALLIVRTFARYVISHIEAERLDRNVIVALHNNSNGGTLSAKGYQRDPKLAEEARDVSLARGEDPDDFFFVTTYELFNFCKEKGFNVVLQDINPTDDGSASAAAYANWRYVNVEAQRGHRDKQFEMLKALQDLT